MTKIDENDVHAAGCLGIVIGFFGGGALCLGIGLLLLPAIKAIGLAIVGSILLAPLTSYSLWHWFHRELRKQKKRTSDDPL